MKKIHYNKLIRDKIPARIRRNGGISKTKTLTKAEFVRELMKKAHEETSSFPKLKSKKEIVSEIADVLAVLKEIKKAKKITKRDIDRAMKENMTKKGGFKKRLYLYWSSDTGYKTNETRNVKH